MDGLHLFLVVLLGVVSCSHDSISGSETTSLSTVTVKEWITTRRVKRYCNVTTRILVRVVSCSHDSSSGSVLEVRPGDNITLYCDCKVSSGVYIVWYRNCSHENQPSLVLKVKHNSFNFKGDFFDHFQFVRNYSSETYDLLIMNITNSDEGLYYCGTDKPIVEDEKWIDQKSVYRYGNVTTRILINSSPDPTGCISDPVPVVSWLMVFSPAFTILSSFICFMLVFHFCQKTDKEPQILSDTRVQRRWDQDEDMCFSRVVYWAKDGQTHH